MNITRNGLPTLDVHYWVYHITIDMFGENMSETIPKVCQFTFQRPFHISETIMNYHHYKSLLTANHHYNKHPFFNG
jgi:hypothetical protein